MLCCCVAAAVLPDDSVARPADGGERRAVGGSRRGGLLAGGGAAPAHDVRGSGHRAGGSVRPPRQQRGSQARQARQGGQARPKGELRRTVVQCMEMGFHGINYSVRGNMRHRAFSAPFPLFIGKDLIGCHDNERESKGRLEICQSGSHYLLLHAPWHITLRVGCVAFELFPSTSREM